MDMIMDYEYGGPNSKHDPRRARPGMAGRNNWFTTSYIYIYIYGPISNSYIINN